MTCDDKAAEESTGKTYKFWILMSKDNSFCLVKKSKEHIVNSPAV